MTTEIQCVDQLKVGQSVKTKKRHLTIVNGTLQFPQLPLIEIPEGVHGEVTFVQFTGEFKVKWVEVEAVTLEHFDSSIFETLEFEE